MPSSWSNAILLVAAGSGTRLQANQPKAFITLQNIPLWLFSTLSFSINLPISHFILVAPPSLASNPENFLLQHPLFSLNPLNTKKKPFHLLSLQIHNKTQILLHVIPGGKERYLSVWKGLQYLHSHLPDSEKQTTTIWIHDAARPFLIPEVIHHLKNARNLNPHLAYFPQLPVPDTLRQQINSASQTVPRQQYRLVQTPQIFPFLPLYSAYANISNFNHITDDITLYEQYQKTSKPVPGNRLLFKVTYPEDLLLASSFAPIFLNQFLSLK